MVRREQIIKQNKACRGEGRNSQSGLINKDEIYSRGEIRATGVSNGVFWNHRKKGMFIEPLFK